MWIALYAASVIGSGSLVVGTAQLGSAYGIANEIGSPARGATLDMLALAQAEGVRALDTAPAYGEAEAIIGESGVAVPIFTKVAPGVDPRTSLARSLDRLGRSSVEVLFFHDAHDALSRNRGVVDQAVELVGNLASRLGVSTYTVEEFREALSDGRFGAVQAPVSVADQRLIHDDLLRKAEVAGVEVYARSVFLQGALLMEAGRLPNELRELAVVRDTVTDVARDEGRPVAEVLAVFVRDLPGVTGVVIGAETPTQLLSNIQAVHSPPLSTEAKARLSAVARLPEAVLDPRLWPRR